MKKNSPLMPRNCFKGNIMGSTVPLGIGPTRTCASNSRRVKCSVAAIASVRDILSSKDDMGAKDQVREGALSRKTGYRNALFQTGLGSGCRRTQMRM